MRQFRPDFSCFYLSRKELRFLACCLGFHDIKNNKCQDCWKEWSK